MYGTSSVLQGRAGAVPVGAVTARATLGVPQGSAQVPFGGNLGEKGPGCPSPLSLGKWSWRKYVATSLPLSPAARQVEQDVRVGSLSLGPPGGDPSPVPHRLTAVGETEEFGVPRCDG